MRLCYLNNCDGFVQSNGSNYWVICDIYADGCNIYDIYGDRCDIYGDGYDISCLYRWNVKNKKTCLGRFAECMYLGTRQSWVKITEIS